MKRFFTLIICIFVIAAFTFPFSIKVRSFDHKDFTRLVFESDQDFSYRVERNTGTDLTLKIKNYRGDIDLTADMSGSDLLNRAENTISGKETGIRVSGKKKFDIIKSFILRNPFRVVFDLNTTDGKTEPVEEDYPLPSSGAEAGSEYSDLEKDNRVNQEINVICIDAGHGGSDLGAVGKKGTLEKDVTLSVSNKLKKIIEKKLGIRVVMTREDDVEMALDSRVSKANNQNAHLFLSIHVNSSYRKSARGPETYFVSLKATDQDSLQLALKENSSFNGISDMPEDDNLKMILWSMAQTEHIKESSKLADYIQNELNILLNTRNRGVKQAPFTVLMRAAMPAVLIEIAFVSNDYEENRLRDESFHDRVAEAIYDGVSKYIYQYNSALK